MNTILTDGELPPLQPQDHPEPHSFVWSEQEMRAIRARDRLVEAAVLAKLREQEPVAWVHPHAGHMQRRTESMTPDIVQAYGRCGWTPLYAAPQPAVVQVPQAVAYLDIGAGGYLDIGSELSNEQLQQLPKGRHMLAIVGTFGVDGYTPAATPEAPATTVAQVSLVRGSA